MNPADPALQSEWRKQPERGSLVLLRAMTWLSLALGRPVSRVVLVGISLYFLLFAAAARNASRAYLRRALGRPPRLAEQFRHFHSFASCIHDRVYLLNDRFDQFDIQVEGEDVVKEVLAAGRGAFLIGAHLGSFEVIRALGRRQPDLKIAMAMYVENAHKINAALAAINPSAMLDVIPLGQFDSMLQVQERLDEGVVVGMMGDRTLAQNPTQPVAFLGQTVAFPVGPMRLAAILKRPVLFICGLYLGGNRYAIHFERLADFTDIERKARSAAVSDAVAAYAGCLERHCRAAPFNWFNFFDFWRPPTETS
ncbi:MAG: acyl-CoA synthetase [Gallionellaceae bacterium]|nr:acyl-CoA synthetase [Gallionellaceae bacterium]